MLCGLILYGGMAIMGILALVRGKISVTPHTVVEGPIARIIGVILLLPLPLGLGLTTLALLATGATGTAQMPLWVAFVPFASVALCVVVSFILGFIGKKPAKKKRPHFDDFDDEDDYERLPRRGGGEGGAAAAGAA